MIFFSAVIQPISRGKNLFWLVFNGSGLYMSSQGKGNDIIVTVSDSNNRYKHYCTDSKGRIARETIKYLLQSTMRGDRRGVIFK